MIIRLLDSIQLSKYSTRALFHKYFVVMKYRSICQFWVLSESPPLKKHPYTIDFLSIMNIHLSLKCHDKYIHLHV